MATWLYGSGWGTREDAIPGEWALLVLCMVALALLGVAVFWFTTLRRERAGADGGETFGIGDLVAHEADDPPEPEPEPDLAFDREREPAPDSTPEAEAEAESELTVEAEPGPAPELEPAREPEPAAAAEHEREPEPAPAPAPEPEPEPAAAFAPEPAAAPAPAAEPVPASSVGPKRLTEEILDRVALERSRRKSVKWKELAALVEREFDVCLHPRTIERALRRRKAEAAESAADSSDAASA